MSVKIHAITAITENACLTPKLDYLRELAGGDNDFITEILKMFITEAPQSVEQSLRFLHERNFEMLRITVHKLKSSVQVVGGYHLTHLIQDIENAAKENGEMDTIQQMLSMLNTEIQHMVKYLCQELNTVNSIKNAA